MQMDKIQTHEEKDPTTNMLHEEKKVGTNWETQHKETRGEEQILCYCT